MKGVKCQKKWKGKREKKDFGLYTKLKKRDGIYKIL